MHDELKWDFRTNIVLPCTVMYLLVSTCGKGMDLCVGNCSTYWHVPVWTSTYWYVLQVVHTGMYWYTQTGKCMYLYKHAHASTFQYIQVHTSMYWYVPVHTTYSYQQCKYWIDCEIGSDNTSYQSPKVCTSTYQYIPYTLVYTGMYFYWIVIGIYSMPILIISSPSLWPTCPTTKTSSCVSSGCAFMLMQVTCSTMRPSWRK